MEVWKSVKGFEDYQVSNYGRLKSLKSRKEIIMKGGIDNTGYRIVSLRNKYIQQKRTIHQLVSIAFLNHVPCGRVLVVNHKDLNKLNNHVDNLEIVTMRENSNQKHKPNQSSKYVGVGWCKTYRKWVSRITINGKRINLGYFTSEIDAHNAYQEKLKTLVSLGFFYY